MSWTGACTPVDERRRRTPRAVVAAAVLAALAALAVPAPAAGARATASQEQFVLDHYLCYGASKQNFEPRTVKVKDQFGSSAVRVLRRVALCNPVSKNGGTVNRRDAHLVCYSAERVEPFGGRRVSITNQFHKEAVLRIGRAIRLCLPSGKSENPQGDVPIPQQFDHYQCYRARPEQPLSEHEVKLQDQFGQRGGLTKQPGMLCNPASKNESQVVNPRDHLVCYGLRSKPPFKTRTVRISNQFETNVAIRVHRVGPLCLPSLKKELPGLPDLVPTIFDLRVNCPSGQGSCVTEVDYEVRNIGTGAAGPFDVLASADPALGTTATTPFGGLPPGGTTGLHTANLGPGDNCFDPDCTVQINVDPTNAVAESDNTNNIATRTEAG